MIHWSNITIPVAAPGVVYTSKRTEDFWNPLFAKELNTRPRTKSNKIQNDIVKFVRASERKPMTQWAVSEVSESIKHSNSENVNII
jgi:hypothetical protein